MAGNYNSNLYAFTLGCLEKDEYIELKQHLQSGGDFNYAELGEYQNLTALLPAILNIETPGHHVKDKVARKLYRLRDKIEAKKTAERDVKEKSEDTAKKTSERDVKEKSEDTAKKKTAPPAEQKPAPPIPPPRPEEPEPPQPVIEEQEEEKASELFNEEIPKTKTEEFEVVKPKRKTAEFFRPKQETQIRERFRPVDEPEFYPDEELPQEEEITEEEEIAEEEFKLGDTHEDFAVDDEPEKYDEPETVTLPPVEPPKGEYYNKSIQPESGKKNYVYILGGFLLFFLIVLGIIFAYINLSSDVKTYKQEVQQLNSELRSLSMQVESNREIQSIIESGDARIVNLSGTNLNPSGSGKVIMNLENNKGFLQISQMPSLPEEKAYQIWVQMGEGSYSLGVVRPVERVEYYPLQVPIVRKGENVRFFVTEEPVNGSERPGRKVYLEGNF